MSQPSLPEENVQGYPRPPLLEPVPQTVAVRLGGQDIVRTNAALRVLETHHAPTYYIPWCDVAATRMAVEGHSFCEWKGRARYWSLSAGGVTAQCCAWDYPEPAHAFRALSDHVAFYAHQMDGCWVGDVPVTPQPGNFYGGWVTPNLAGRIKGAPGTEVW